MRKHNWKFAAFLRRLSKVCCLCLLVMVLQACAIATDADSEAVPEGFVELQALIPTLELDVRYASSDNFIGEPITGYLAAKIYLSQQAAARLAEVQAELASDNLGLKVFDGYRPQRAVDHFVRWAQDLRDNRMQSRYYPAVAKEHLFRDGYIAARSGHTRGSTVDLTLVHLHTGEELDMGSPWDFFDPMSWPDSRAVTEQHYANRMRLREIMLRHGFNPLATEWWHFTLREEPFPEQYFDFPIARE